MKKAIAIVALAGLTGVAGADTVANWGFNDNALPGGGFGYMVGDLPMAADVGMGSLDMMNWDSSDTAGEYNTIDSFGGTDLDAIDGVSGGSFSILGDTNNGASAVFSVDGTNWENMSLTFNRRGTGTGFSSMIVEIFDGGTSLGVLDTFGSGTSTWSSNTYSLAALDGIANASIHFTFDGATSGNGNNRLDNVTIIGDVVPAPGTAALLGLGGLVATRRRRA